MKVTDTKQFEIVPEGVGDRYVRRIWAVRVYTGAQQQNKAKRTNMHMFGFKTTSQS